MSDTQPCYRHEGRSAGVRCQRCERPICPDCMRQASVGFHCPECTRSGAQRVYTARSLATRPIVTQALLVANVLVALAVASTGGDLFSPTGSQVYEELVLFAAPTIGDTVVPGVIGVEAGEWWRLVGSGFLHYGLLHLGMNMWFLWILGPQLEGAFGRVGFGVLYGASLLAGSCGVLVSQPFALTAGASGALYGMLGAALVLQRARGLDPWSSGLGGVLVINLLITFTIPIISIGGHVGGLLGGLAVSAILVQVGVRQRNQPLALALAAALAVSLFLAAVWAADYAVTHGSALLPV